VIEPAWVHDLDEDGYWHGTCSGCGTDHEGYPPGTLGAVIQCVRRHVERSADVGLIDRIDTFERDLADQRNAVIQRFLQS
jgi:hypothetical protein